MKDILQGFLYLTIFKIGLIKDHKLLSVIGQRKVSCNSCPLKSGNFCSKKKTVSINEYKHKGIFKSVLTKLIQGCGCYLPAKYFSNSRCPLNRWKKF